MLRESWRLGNDPNLTLYNPVRRVYGGSMGRKFCGDLRRDEMVDISKESVEAMAMAADCDLCCVDTAIALRAQFARIAELEEVVRELDAIAREAHSARNDALREAAKVAERHPMRFAGQTEDNVRQAMSRAILALIKEPTT